MAKDQRLYIRLSRQDKEFFKSAADRIANGNMNTLFEMLLKKLKQELEEFEQGDDYE